MTASLFYFVPFFSHSIYHLRPSYLPVLAVPTQIRGSFPPSPLRFVSSICIARRLRFSPFLPRRLASNCAYPRSALSAVDPFVFFFAYIFKISPRRDSNARTNTINSSIRGLPLVHRGDRRYCSIYLVKTGESTAILEAEGFITRIPSGPSGSSDLDLSDRCRPRTSRRP